MKIKFANGAVKECAAPTEQKIFKTVGGEAVSTGWVLLLKLTGNITSAELDGLLTAENVASLEFSAETESGEEEALFGLDGYSRLTSSTIRHAEDAAAAYAEIQLSKGV